MVKRNEQPVQILTLLLSVSGQFPQICVLVSLSRKYSNMNNNLFIRILYQKFIVMVTSECSISFAYCEDKKR